MLIKTCVRKFQNFYLFLMFLEMVNFVDLIESRFVACFWKNMKISFFGAFLPSLMFFFFGF